MAILVAVSMVVILGVAALAVDVGLLTVARAEASRSADAAALAGASVLLNEDRLKGPTHMQQVIMEARTATAVLASANPIMGVAPTVNLNTGNASNGELVIGYLANPYNHSAPLVLNDPMKFNAVRATVLRDELHGGEINLAFARIFGYSGGSLGASATASFEDGIVGYQVRDEHRHAKLLPFGLQEDVWYALLAGGATPANDQYQYDADSGTVSDGSDDVPELNLYPGAGTGQLPPGNFGTVDIGSSNNSTADISRQIRDGVSADDLACYGGTLRLGDDGTLLLNGDTGLSAGIKDDLAAIRGQPRTILLYSTVAGPGNNAYYTVTGFAGVRIMYVKLTGAMSGKKLIIQPAVVVDGTSISESGANSYYIYRPVMLTR